MSNDRRIVMLAGLVSFLTLAPACASSSQPHSSADAGQTGTATHTGTGTRTTTGTASATSTETGSTTSTGTGTVTSTGTGTATGTGGGTVAFDECSHPKAEWLFCSGFEEANWQSVWDDYDGNPEPSNHLMADLGPSNSPSNHVMRLRVTPKQRGGADLVKVVSAHDRLYARWYALYEPGFNFDAPNHGSGLFAGARDDLGVSGNRPSGTDFFQATLDYSLGSELHAHSYRSYVYYPGMYQDCADPNGSCWGDSLPCEYDTGAVYCTDAQDLPKAGFAPPTLEAGQWYCVEEMVDAGTPAASAAGADGGIDFWIDGAEQAPDQLHHWMRASASVQPNILWLSLFHHDGTHSDVGVYYDNVVVSTARIGCR